MLSSGIPDLTVIPGLCAIPRFPVPFVILFFQAIGYITCDESKVRDSQLRI